MKKYLEVLAISLIAILAPIKTMALTVVVLTLADMIFGIISALVQKEPITSANLKRTPIKLVVYLSALVFGFLTQKYLMGDSFPITNLVATLVGATELKSILESLEIIYGRPILSALIAKLAEKSSKID